MNFNAQLIKQTAEHVRLHLDGAIKVVALIGVAVPDQIGNDHPKVRRQWFQAIFHRYPHTGMP